MAHSQNHEELAKLAWLAKLDVPSRGRKAQQAATTATQEACYEGNDEAFGEAAEAPQPIARYKCRVAEAPRPPRKPGFSRGEVLKQGASTSRKRSGSRRKLFSRRPS